MKTLSTRDLKRNAILWVIIALSVTTIPHFIDMPAILIPITLVPIAWRLLAEFRNWKPMPLIFRVFATVVAVSVLVVTYGGLMGRRAAVSLLVMMLALKLLETFSIRDARIVASLCLFLCATQFLFSQRFAMVFYIVACLLSTLIALMYLHRQEAYLPIHEAPDTGRSMFTELGFGLRLLLLAFPIGLTMFLLFPRWSSPLWGVPEAALDARSGLSNSMTPGSIQNLFMDDSPAFRATFQGSVPNNVFMYWRGPVFWDFDGQTWQSSYLSRNLPAETKPSLADAQFRYEIQMEPTEQHWIFALDYPAMVPKGTRLTMDYQLVSRRSITQLRIYPMASDPAFQDSPELKNTLLRAALETPVGYNPRTAQMMSEWRAETSSDAEIIRRALAYFNQEEFHYTLNPPLLSRHTVDEFLFETRRGFCEHYASAFTIMMRMAGIPARVVTGYQGGWYSGIGSYVLVRQSDAHAWSEVWIKGTGWTRIDPTAAVAPDRVEQGAMNSLAERRHLLDFEWLMSARNTLDLLQRGWNNWVIAFGADAQSRLFTIFGWGIFDSARLIIAMMSIIMVAGTAIFLLLPFFFRFRAAREQDAVLKLWQKFIRKLEKAGFTAKPSMGPIELGTLAGAQLEFAANRIEQITELYIRCRYSKNTDGREKLTELVRDFKPQTAA